MGKEESSLLHLSKGVTYRVKDFIYGIETTYSARKAIDLVRRWRNEGLEVSGLSLKNPTEVVDSGLQYVGQLVRGKLESYSYKKMGGKDIREVLAAIGEEINIEIVKNPDRRLLKEQIAIEIAKENLEALGKVDPHVANVLRENMPATSLDSRSFELLGSMYHKVLPVK